MILGVCWLAYVVAFLQRLSIGSPVFGHLVDITGSYQMSWLLLVSLAVMAAIAINFVREERRRI